MGTVQGFSLARSLELQNEQIISGLIGLDGHLLLERRNGDTVDAGMVKGAKGDDAVRPFPSYTSGSTTRYVRIGVLDGVHASQGAALQLIISGLGSFGTARRGTVLVHVAQRGVGGINLTAWSWGLDAAAAGAITLYTRQMGDFLFEVWALISTYAPAVTATILSTFSSTVYLDSQTTTAPSGLVAGTIARSDSPMATTALAGISELATAAEVVTGTDNVRSVTPLGLAGLRATQAQVDAGTDTARYVTPKMLKDTQPLPNSWLGNGISSASIAGTGWGSIQGALRLELPAYSRDLLVEINYGALGVTSAGYWMIGVSIFQASGPVWTIPPEGGDPSFDGAVGTPLYGIVAPFSQSTQQVQLKGQKRVRIPAGIPAVFQMAARKSTTAATAAINYSSMEVNFLRFL